MLLVIEDGLKIPGCFGSCSLEWADVLVRLKITTVPIEFRMHLDFFSLLYGLFPAAADRFMRWKST
jgi:hypothetical protein